MSLEKMLVETDVFYSLNPSVALDFDYLIDKQKRDSGAAEFS